jgi:DnaJ-class molecular chaperone
MRRLSSSPPLAREGSFNATTCCPRCGGSGLLRQGDRRYRTCLDCLGQGRLLAEKSESLQLGGISVPVSVSAAR